MLLNSVNFSILLIVLFLLFVSLSCLVQARERSEPVAVLERKHKEQCIIEEGINQTLLRCNDFKPIARVIAEAQYPEFLFAYCPASSGEEGRCFIVHPQVFPSEKIPPYFMQKLRDDVINRPGEQLYYFWVHSRDDFLEDVITLGLPLLGIYLLTTRYYSWGWSIAAALVANLVLRPASVRLGGWVRSESEVETIKYKTNRNRSSGVMTRAYA